MQTMHWYNPVTKQEEDVPAPMSYAQAIEMLSGHPDSDRFIEEYRRLSATHPDTIVSLTLTGEACLSGTPEWAASRVAANLARLVAPERYRRTVVLRVWPYGYEGLRSCAGGGRSPNILPAAH